MKHLVMLKNVQNGKKEVSLTISTISNISSISSINSSSSSKTLMKIHRKSITVLAEIIRSGSITHTNRMPTKAGGKDIDTDLEILATSTSIT